MREKYDVVIIGAGPAGLLAAKAIVQNGYSAAVIDRKKDIAAVTRSCGQSLLPPNEYFFGDMFHHNTQDNLFCFTTTGLSFPYTGEVRELFTWHMYSPGMEKMQFGFSEPGKSPPIALSYDKATMLQCMVDDITSDNVDFFPETEFTGFQWGPNGVVVQAGDRAFQATFVIAADGTNSRAVERLGYNSNRTHIANLHAVSYYITNFHPPHKDSIITAVNFIDDKPLYMFMLPRPASDEWTLILLTLEPGLDLSDMYDRVASDSRYKDWFKHAERTAEFAAVESIMSPVIKPFRNNVLVVGDAGSCQELECLGAMMSGWKGGLAVAGQLKAMSLGIPARGISDYEDWWLNTYIRKYDYQDYLSIFGIAYLFPKPDIIDYIFGQLKAEPFPPTFNPYTAVGLLGARLQGLVPKMMSERPDILQIIGANMAVFPSDLLAKTLKK